MLILCGGNMIRKLLLLVCVAMIAMGCSDDKKSVKRKPLKASIPVLKKIVDASSNTQGKDTSEDTSKEEMKDTSGNTKKQVLARTSSSNTQIGTDAQEQTPTEEAALRTRQTMVLNQQGFYPVRTWQNPQLVMVPLGMTTYNPMLVSGTLSSNGQYLLPVNGRTMPCVQCETLVPYQRSSIPTW